MNEVLLFVICYGLIPFALFCAGLALYELIADAVHEWRGRK